MDYFFDYYMARCKLDRLEGRLAFIRAVMPHVEGIRNSVKRRLYVQRLSELTGVEEKHFFESLKDHESSDVTVRPKKKASNLIEKRVLGVLMNRPGLIQMLKGKEVIRYVRDDDVSEVLKKMIEWFEEKKQLEISSFVGLLEKIELRDLVMRTALDMAECDETESKRVLSDYLKYVEKKFVREEAERITERLSEAEKKGNDREVMELLQQKRQVLAFIKSNFI